MNYHQSKIENPPRLDELRILEIGDRSLFSCTFPDNTLLLWTGIRKIPSAPGRRNFSIGTAWLLLKALRKGSFDLIICYPPLYNPLGLSWNMRLIGRYLLLFPSHLFRSCGVLFLRLTTKTPIAALDTEDTIAVNRHNFFLFPKCRVYFKRELPTDFWKVFYKTAHPNLPTARFRQSRFHRQCIDKLRPISLGISEEKVQQIAELSPAKSFDVFFAGKLTTSHLRALGAEQLLALRAEGYTIDLAEPDLSQAEYFARCARAWLTWSPEGYGWDCFRHYEAAVCGSVPVINNPTIYRYEPLLNGIHCIYYDVEGDGLKRAIVQALSDKRRLATMAQAARDHVLSHHTHRRLCEHIIETALLEELRVEN